MTFMSPTVERKNLLINLLLVVASLAVALVAAELGLRTILRIQEKGTPLVSDGALGYRTLPNTDWNGDGMYVWDSNGFRNKMVPEGADIVAMGDSMTLGLGVKTEEAWPQVLAEISGKTVYQMAQCQHSIVQYSYYLDTIKKPKAKTYIIGLFLGNDLFDSFGLVYGSDYWPELRNPNVGATMDEYNRIVEKSGEQRLAILTGVDEKSDSHKSFKIRTWLRDKSRVYALLGDATRGLREKIGLAENKVQKEARLQSWAEENPGDSFIFNEDPIKTTLSPTYRLEALDMNNPITAEGLRITKKLLLEMNQKTKTADSNLVVVLIPTKELVYGRFFEETNRSITDELKKNIEISNKLVGAIESFCLDSGIDYFDLTADLSKALEENKKIFKESLDVHPLPLGQRVIAESIYSYLLKNNFLK